MIVKSVLTLQVIKGLELLLPIAALPFVIEVYGLGGVGELVLFQAVAQYLILMGDWGFNATASKEFAFEKIKYYKWVVLFRDIQRVKMLYLLSLLLMVICAVSFLDLDARVTFLFYLWVVASVMQVRWYFQARFRLPSLLLVNLVLRIGYAVYVFWFLEADTPLYVYVIFFIAPMCGVAIYSNVVFLNDVWLGLRSAGAKQLPGVRWRWVSGRNSITFRRMFKDGAYLIVSRVLSALITPAFLFLGKLMYGLEFVGFMGVALRIVSAFSTLLQPLIDVVYPKLANKSRVDALDGMKYLHRIVLVILVLSGLCYTAIYVAGDWGLDVLGVPTLEYRNQFLSFLSPLIAIGLLNSLYSHALVALALSRYIIVATISGTLSGAVLFGLFYGFSFGELGVALTMTSMQCVMLMALMTIFYRNTLFSSLQKRCTLW